MNKYLVKIAASAKKDVAVGAVVGAGVGAAAEAAHHANKALPPGFIQGSKKPPLSDKEYHTNQAAMHENKLQDLAEIRQKLIKSKNLSGDASQKIDRQINRLKSAKAKSLFDAMKSKGEPIGKATSAMEGAAAKLSKIPKKGLLAGALLGSSIGLAKHYLSKDKSK